MTNCIRGRVFRYNRFDSPSTRQLYPNCPVLVSQYNPPGQAETIARGETNSQGEYEIHGIPRGIHINVGVFAFDDHPGGPLCQGSQENIFTGLEESDLSIQPTGLKRIGWKLRQIFSRRPEPQRRPCIEIDDIDAICAIS